MFCSFRYYYIKKFYDFSIHAMDLKRLEYLRNTVISGYKMLAKEDSIEKAIQQVRHLEEELGEDPIDFSEYESQYKKNINNVFTRGYF